MLPYEMIFSRARGKINDPKEIALDRNDLTEIYVERLHSVLGNPRVRKLFSEVTLDDEIQEIKFKLNNSVDEQSDNDFVIEVFVLGMIISWLQPQVDSVLHTAPMIGGKEEKKLLDNHKNMMDRLEDMKKELHNRIRDYGYLYNSYLYEES